MIARSSGTDLDVCCQSQPLNILALGETSARGSFGLPRCGSVAQFVGRRRGWLDEVGVSGIVAMARGRWFYRSGYSAHPALMWF